MLPCLHVDGIDIAGMNIYVGNCTVKNFDDVVAGKIRTCHWLHMDLVPGPLAPRAFAPFHDPSIYVRRTAAKPSRQGNVYSTCTENMLVEVSGGDIAGNGTQTCS